MVTWRTRFMTKTTMRTSSSAPGKSPAASPSPIPTRAATPMRISPSLKRRVRSPNWRAEAGDFPVATKTSRQNETGTLPQRVRRGFSGVGYDEAMRRAREIVPFLRERAQRAEDARMLIRDNEQLLHESGLFRFHQPKAFGGVELDFVADVDIQAGIALCTPLRVCDGGVV